MITCYLGGFVVGGFTLRRTLKNVEVWIWLPLFPCWGNSPFDHILALFLTVSLLPGWTLGLAAHPTLQFPHHPSALMLLEPPV